MEELLRCPFCGGEAEIIGGDTTYWISCNKCRAETGLLHTEAEAIAAWNMRTQNIGKKECCEQDEEQEESE